MEIYINSKKKHRANVSPIKTALTGGMIFGAIGLFVYAVFFSPLFSVKEIGVSGSTGIPGDEIKNSISYFLMDRGKIFPLLGEKNMFFWDCGEKEISAVENKFPFIESLKIDRDFLARKVLISVAERQRYGIACESISDAEKKCFWFDRSGIAFAVAPAAEGGLVNKIEVNPDVKIELGRPIAAETEMKNLITIFDVLDRSGLRIKSLVITDPALGEARTVPGVSPEILFSLKNDSSFALPAIEKLKERGLEKYSYIDLRVESRLYYRLK